MLACQGALPNSGEFPTSETMCNGAKVIRSCWRVRVHIIHPVTSGLSAMQK